MKLFRGKKGNIGGGGGRGAGGGAGEEGGGEGEKEISIRKMEILSLPWKEFR